MLTTIQNALKTKEIRMKLLYVLIGLVIVRIGCNIPIPGTKPDVMQNLFSSNQSLGFLDVMTGGSFSRMSIFALNITPYITASIILQLLTIAIPRLEEMQKMEKMDVKRLTSTHVTFQLRSQLSKVQQS